MKVTGYPLWIYVDLITPLKENKPSETWRDAPGKPSSSAGVETPGQTTVSATKKLNYEMKTNKQTKPVFLQLRQVISQIILENPLQGEKTNSICRGEK